MRQWSASLLGLNLWWVGEQTREGASRGEGALLPLVLCQGKPWCHQKCLARTSASVTVVLGSSPEHQLVQQCCWVSQPRDSLALCLDYPIAAALPQAICLFQLC